MGEKKPDCYPVTDDMRQHYRAFAELRDKITAPLEDAPYKKAFWALKAMEELEGAFLEMIGIIGEPAGECFLCEEPIFALFHPQEDAIYLGDDGEKCCPDCYLAHRDEWARRASEEGDEDPSHD